MTMTSCAGLTVLDFLGGPKGAPMGFTHRG